MLAQERGGGKEGRAIKLCPVYHMLLLPHRILSPNGWDSHGPSHTHHTAAPLRQSGKSFLVGSHITMEYIPIAQNSLGGWFLRSIQKICRGYLGSLCFVPGDMDTSLNPRRQLCPGSEKTRFSSI